LEIMTQHRNPDAEALHRLADLLAEDLLATPDEEVLAEAAARDDRQAERAEAREFIARALRMHGNPDLPSRSTRTIDAGQPAPGVLRSLAAVADRSAHKVAEKWRGLLADLPALPMAAEPTMAEPTRSQPLYSGVQVPLDQVFDGDTLARELGWASGSLRIMCARSQDGRIRSIKASVKHCRPGHAPGSGIVLDFRDQAGARETLSLRPGQPSATTRGSRLSGDPRRLELAVSLLRTG
jgi:hypothetical protein